MVTAPSTGTDTLRGHRLEEDKVGWCIEVKREGTLDLRVCRTGGQCRVGDALNAWVGDRRGSTFLGDPGLAQDVQHVADAAGGTIPDVADACNRAMPDALEWNEAAVAKAVALTREYITSQGVAR